MRTYQVYTANDAGEIVAPEVFLASDDVAATERAQRRSRYVELWEGCRRVKRWDLETPCASRAAGAPPKPRLQAKRSAGLLRCRHSRVVARHQSHRLVAI